MPDPSFLFESLLGARRRFGLARLELGAVLELIRSNRGWEGRAESFSALLEEANIREATAYQYMRIARKFFNEMGLSNVQLRDLAMVSFTTLDIAARLVDEENIDEIMAIVTTLSSRDANATLLEREEAVRAAANKQPRSLKRVDRLVSLYRNMPDEERIDVRNALRVCP